MENQYDPQYKFKLQLKKLALEIGKNFQSLEIDRCSPKSEEWTRIHYESNLFKGLVWIIGNKKTISELWGGVDLLDNSKVVSKLGTDLINPVDMYTIIPHIESIRETIKDFSEVINEQISELGFLKKEYNLGDENSIRLKQLEEEIIKKYRYTKCKIDCRYVINTNDERWVYLKTSSKSEASSSSVFAAQCLDIFPNFGIDKINPLIDFQLSLYKEASK